jgi:acylpyruvate hydrolase
VRLATIRQPDGTTRAARVEGEDVVLLPFGDVGQLLASGDEWVELAAREGPRVRLEEAELACVVPSPSKVFCVGLNYLRHVLEEGGEVPSYPTLFAKFPEALTGPHDCLTLPRGSHSVDWEAELVVVIGKTIRDADEIRAGAAIAGFSVGNDVSMRDWQRRTTQWLQGKTWEAASPVGPVLVTPDEVGGTRPDLAIRCIVDDVVMQNARTSDLLFDPVELVAYISSLLTLRPGDLVFTGTPEGVGFARTPPVYLQPRQVMITEIEGIGQLVNKLLAEGDLQPASTDARRLTER